MKRKRSEKLPTEQIAPDSLNGPFQPWVILLVGCVPVLAALYTYAPYLDGDFVFDDAPTVRDNQAIRSGNAMLAAFGPVHSPISNRPLTCLTFAVNHALHQLRPRGYHVFSLALHLANVALLFGIVRRTLRGPNLGAIFDPAMALFTAAGLALPWAVHPLSSEAVTYITQRTTLLMSFFMLSAIYCLLRGSRSPENRLGWDIGAIFACIGGTMSKEEFIAVPLLLILFERAYLYSSWSSLAQRAGVYLGLVSTMLIVPICVYSGPPNETVGYKTVPQVTAAEWLMTEAYVIVHYLRLAAVPYPLVGAYDWPVVRDFSAAIIPGALVLALLAATIYLWFTRPWWGWLGAMFFLLLAPTSSVFPIITEVIAERRMYLPVLIYTVPTVVGFTLLLDFLRRRYHPTLGTCAAVVFVLVVFPNGLAMYAAAEHAAVFQNEKTFWADAFAKNDCTNQSFQSGLILSAYGKVVGEQHNDPETKLKALKLFERALECESPSLAVRGNHAAALVDVGRLAEAQSYYREIMAHYPGLTDRAISNIRNNFAWSLLLSFQNDGSPKSDPPDPRLLEADTLVRRAIENFPFEPNYFNTLGIARFYLGDSAGAEQALKEAIQHDKHNIKARENLAQILAAQGRAAEAAAIRNPQPQP